MSRYAGAGWVRNSLGVENMSPLGRAVANFLGDLARGIYHLSSESLERVDWSDQHSIEYIWYGEMATVDFPILTALVVLAHDRMLRVSLEGCGPKYTRMRFHQRLQRTGGIAERVPDLLDHASEIRRFYRSEI